MRLLDATFSTTNYLWRTWLYIISHTHTCALTQPPLHMDLRTVGNNSMGVPPLHESVCSYENYTKCCYLLP